MHAKRSRKILYTSVILDGTYLTFSYSVNFVGRFVTSLVAVVYKYV